jgi:hypothetical protein
MAAKVKVQPVSRLALAPLVALAEHLRAALPGWEDAVAETGRTRQPIDLDHDLAHLAHHDQDGFLTAALDDEVLGFAAGYVRSRLLTITHFWLLPEREDERLAAAMMRRLLAFGDRAGVAEVAFLALGGAAIQGLALRHGLRPRFPVYRLTLEPDLAYRAGQQLSRLLPGTERTDEAHERRIGLGDLDRLDRLIRGFNRAIDHEYWLASRQLRLVTVREGKRVAAYAYGGAGQCGPVVATTPEAALAALGHALAFAGAASVAPVAVLIPALFEPALDHLLGAGAQCRAVSQWMSRHPVSGMDRYVLAGQTLA